MPEHLAFKVKSAVERAIRQEHPWVFEGGIVKQSKAGKAGDLAVIFDNKDNKFLAVGLYDPLSPIRIKLLQFKNPAHIDEHWFRNKIAQAANIREPLFATDTNSYRLIHGENDGLPGLVADVYDTVLVIKLYTAIWLPYLQDLLPILLTVSSCETVVLRLSRALQNEPEVMQGLQDGQVLRGKLVEETIIFREHGLRFAANVVHGHKTGYFLDHRHNRQKIGTLAAGKNVLDIFAYAGGFSVHALAGGAREVTSLDISQQALEMAKKNVALNELQAHHQTMAMDAFAGLEQLYQEGKRFDVVIVDPPSFAKRDNERDKALLSYARLARLAVRIVQRSGILMLASCSSRVSAEDFFATVLAEMNKSERKYQELERTFHDIDHPIGFPEGAYLKSIYFQMDGW